MRRTYLGLALATAALLAAPMIVLDPPSPESKPSNKNNMRHGTGSKPVPGGGARERARRLARMQAQQEKPE